MNYSTISCCIGSALLAFSFASASAQTLDSAVAHARGTYVQHNLVSDGTVSADHTDAALINPWGIAFNPFGVVWVANNGSGTSTLYDGNGVAASLVVQIPTSTTPSGGNPTGVVYNASAAFVRGSGSTAGPSRFIFVTEDGIVAGWAPSADTTHALLAVDNSAAHAIYKGVALSAGNNRQLLYATDFHNNRVDVFDGTFAPVTLAADAFKDARLPSGYAPFGIQAIGGDIVVTYALQDADKEDEQHGRGLGFVDVYDPVGKLLARVASRGGLNAPWGIALAPAGFGRFSNSLLIGNFGDGRINAYDMIFNIPLGELRDSNERPIQIDGLWGIAFGNGLVNQPVNTLFFTAGPGDEAHGLYGRIDVQGATTAD